MYPGLVQVRNQHREDQSYFIETYRSGSAGEEP